MDPGSGSGETDLAWSVLGGAEGFLVFLVALAVGAGLLSFVFTFALCVFLGSTVLGGDLTPSVGAGSLTLDAVDEEAAAAAAWREERLLATGSARSPLGADPRLRGGILSYDLVGRRISTRRGELLEDASGANMLGSSISSFRLRMVPARHFALGRNGPHCGTTLDL